MKELSVLGLAEDSETVSDPEASAGKPVVARPAFCAPDDDRSQTQLKGGDGLADVTALNTDGFKPSAGWKLDNLDLLQEREVRALHEHPALFRLFDGIFGEPARCFDYRWLRPVPPGGFSAFHMDNIYMGAGSHRLLTAWTPLCDAPLEVGGLALLEGSHALPGWAKTRETYGSYDVDQGDVRGGGHLSDCPREMLEKDPAGVWRTCADFQAGDVVVFPMHTLHGSVKNTSRDLIRLSTDMRFQPAADPIDPRWVGDRPGHYRYTSEDRHNPDIFPVSMEEQRKIWGV
jgi:hypothetical protein